MGLEDAPASACRDATCSLPEFPPLFAMPLATLRSYTFWSYWLRVAIIVACLSPVVCGDDPPLDQTRVAVAGDALPELPPPPVESNSALEPRSVAPVGDACSPNYWIVSSRQSVQSIDECGPWGLSVVHRTPDGQCHRESLEALSAQLVPGIPVCIFAHGSFVSWEGQAREAEQAYSAIRRAVPDQPVQMIFFTWPSDGPYTRVFPVDVAINGNRAEFNGFHLAWLMSCVPDGSPISLVCHSHGSRVVLAAMHLVAGGAIQGHCFTGRVGTHRYRIVLAAAALDHHWLNPGQRYDRALNPVEALLHVRNQKDAALGLYPLHRPFARRALARSGFTKHDLEHLGWNAAKIRECDVSHLVKRRHLWPYYYTQPGIIASMAPYIYFF